MPGTNIRCMLEDSKGYLWIGTQDGLFKYDSRTTKIFNKDQGYKNTIGGSDIRDVIESNTEVWMTSTQGGIDKISKITSSPVLHLSQNRFPGLKTNTITSLLYTDSLLYIGTEKGLYTYDPYTDKISKLKIVDSTFTDFIDKIDFFNDYIIVFIRNRGCLSYNIRKKKPVFFLNTTNYSAKASHRFYSITRSSINQWVLGTSAGINRVTLTITGKIYFEKDPFPYIPKSNNPDVYATAIDKDKNIWFSTENNLIKLDPLLKKTYLIENTLESDIEFLNNVYKIYCDSKNNIWLGCQNGLFLLKNSPPSTLTYYKSSENLSKISHAYYLFPANDSIILATAENGLYKVNIHTSKIDEIDNTQVYDFILLDPYNRTIVSNKTGLHEFKSGSFNPIKSIYPEFKLFSNYTINSAVKINSSEIVMGTENNKGILIWNFIKHHIINITAESDGLKLDNNIINGIFKIKEDVFCVLTESSLLYIDYKIKLIRKISLLKNTSGEEYALFFDMCRIGNMYYLSSYGNGVLVLDESFTIKKIISTNNGLSNNSVYKLLPWKDSLLFMTTNLGLNILHIKNDEIRQLYQSDGLHSDVFEETSGYVYKNMILVGGINGFTIIYPENLAPNKSPPLLYISKIQMDFSKGRYSDTSNIESNYFYISNNVFQTTFYFSGINYSNPERTVFAYKIAELHKNWKFTNNQDFVSLIGINPGTYHLQVQAFNEDGVPSDIKELTLIFLPKWYQTWWFKLSLALIFIASVYALYRLRINQLKKEQEIRSKLASDLHDDLGSTLNSVKVYANLALMEKDQDKYLFKIKESVQEAITGVKDMIWVLDDRKDSIENLLSRISQFASSLCEASSIRYKQVLSEGARDHKLGRAEKRNLYMILKEAVNNTCKYSGAREMIIEIAVNKKKTDIRIKDDGKGFDPTTAGEGNGLKNMKLRARQIRYDISLVSSPGNGTHIRLQKL